MKRIDCLNLLATLIQDELVVVTLGVTKHEWEMINHRDGNCYLSGMGTTTPFGLGLALGCLTARWWCWTPTAAFSSA